MRLSKIAVIGCALMGLSGAVHAETTPRPGFRLLVLDNQLARWEPGSTLSYAFAKSAMSFAKARNCGGLSPVEPLLERARITPARFGRETAAAFAMWEAAANISFREIANPAFADIVIGAQTEPRGRAFTDVRLRDAPENGIERALICLNSEMSWKIGFDGNLDAYDLRYTLAHEIGHAIGLDHPGAAGQLMGYRYDERQRGLQPGDVAGAIRLYGARAPVQIEASRPQPNIAASSASRSQARKPSALGLGDQGAR